MNEGLGGTIELGDYRFPVNLPIEKTRAILEDQAEDQGHVVRGSSFPYFSIELGDEKQYDLIYGSREEQGVQAVALRDEDADETIGFYELDELLEE